MFKLVGLLVLLGGNPEEPDVLSSREALYPSQGECARHAAMLAQKFINTGEFHYDREASLHWHGVVASSNTVQLILMCEAPRELSA